MVFFKREANNCKVLTKCWKDGGTKCAGYAKGFRGAIKDFAFVNDSPICHWMQKMNDRLCNDKKWN